MRTKLHLNKRRSEKNRDQKTPIRELNVFTYDATVVKNTSAKLNGEIFTEQGYLVKERGFCYGKFPDPGH